MESVGGGVFDVFENLLACVPMGESNEHFGVYVFA